MSQSTRGREQQRSRGDRIARIRRRVAGAEAGGSDPRLIDMLKAILDLLEDEL